jgi:hypothetical protein
MRALARAAAVAALGAVVLAACEGEPAPGEAIVDLGTGEWRFEPLADDQEVTLVAGSQGGYHVWTSVRARGLASARDVWMKIEYEPLDAPAEVQSSRVQIDMDPMGDGTVEFLGFPAQLFAPETFDGRRTLLRVTLDGDGARGSDERVVVPRYVPIR